MAEARKQEFMWFIRLAVFAAFMTLTLPTAAFASEGNIDATNKYSWSENAGWHNYRPTDAGGTVGTYYLEGYIWCENIGWVKLGTGAGGTSGDPAQYANTNAANWGVNNDGAGNLSGYAWSENAGWINFDSTYSQITVNTSTGEFDGYAWSENFGWIHFKNASPAYNVQTNWRPGDILSVVLRNAGDTEDYSTWAMGSGKALDTAYIMTTGECVLVKNNGNVAEDFSIAAAGTNWTLGSSTAEDTCVVMGLFNVDSAPVAGDFSTANDLINGTTVWATYAAGGGGKYQGASDGDNVAADTGEKLYIYLKTPSSLTQGAEEAITVTVGCRKH